MPATQRSKQFDKGTEFAFVADNFTLDEVIDKISTIYADPTNVILPIIETYSLATMALNGTTPDDLAKIIDNSRANCLKK